MDEKGIVGVPGGTTARRPSEDAPGGEKGKRERALGPQTKGQESDEAKRRMMAAPLISDIIVASTNSK